MAAFVNPVGRKIAVSSGPLFVSVELVNWAGIALMLHLSHGTSGYTCSHERTGFSIAKGPTPEAALATAISKIRPNLGLFITESAKLPVLNP